MPYKDKIINISQDFNGLLENVDLLNGQLLYLKSRGLENLVDKFLTTRNAYTLLPDLFELFIARWILSLKNIEKR